MKLIIIRLEMEFVLLKGRDKMKLVLSLNNKNFLYDYKSMGVDTFVLGCKYSFHTPYVFSLDEIKELTDNHKDVRFYIAINYLYDQSMIDQVKEFIDELSQMNVYGLLFQDFGVFQMEIFRLR